MKRRSGLAIRGHALGGRCAVGENAKPPSSPSHTRQRRPDPAPAAHRYLEISYADGKPRAARLRFARGSGATTVRSHDVGDGLRVDYDVDDNAIGIQLTTPGAVTPERLNRLLIELGQAPLAADHGSRWWDEHAFPRWSLAVDYLI
jgi:hypothetical protein